jgi:hypothetical protein
VTGLVGNDFLDRHDGVVVDRGDRWSCPAPFDTVYWTDVVVLSADSNCFGATQFVVKITTAVTGIDSLPIDVAQVR